MVSSSDRVHGVQSSIVVLLVAFLLAKLKGYHVEAQNKFYFIYCQIVSLIFGNYIKKHQEKLEQAKLDGKQTANKDSDLSSTTTLELPDKLSQENNDRKLGD